MNLDLHDWTQFGFAALSEQCPELEDMEIALVRVALWRVALPSVLRHRTFPILAESRMRAPNRAQ
jgi:hypothetical protein